jgi:bifunctional non-homologous end joining protein LigD
VAAPTIVDVDGHQLKLSNLDKVLYPEVGFTKAQIVEYYARIAPTMLRHLGDRCVTLRRYPNGVDADSFFEKRCPKHRPEWVPVAPGPGDKGGAIEYCVLDSPASLVWAANLAALELHTPMARATDIESPTMVVFDLDPGAPAAMRECAEIGLLVRDTLAGLGLTSLAKTSGSKGLQVYLPLNTPHEHDHTRSFSLAVAQVIEKHQPKLVVTEQSKQLRKGKILIDWSQNARFKTTVCVYSLRARPRPTVSTPVTWDEVERAADGEELSFEAFDVLDRVDDFGDLFEPAATLEQTLPPPAEQSAR